MTDLAPLSRLARDKHTMCGNMTFQFFEPLHCGDMHIHVWMIRRPPSDKFKHSYTGTRVHSATTEHSGSQQLSRTNSSPAERSSHLSNGTPYQRDSESFSFNIYEHGERVDPLTDARFQAIAVIQEKKKNAKQRGTLRTWNETEFTANEANEFIKWLLECYRVHLPQKSTGWSIVGAD